MRSTTLRELPSANYRRLRAREDTRAERKQLPRTLLGHSVRSTALRKLPSTNYYRLAPPRGHSSRTKTITKNSPGILHAKHHPKRAALGELLVVCAAEETSLSSASSYISCTDRCTRLQQMLVPAAKQFSLEHGLYGKVPRTCAGPYSHKSHLSRFAELRNSAISRRS
jgi:hypothetical protein